MNQVTVDKGKAQHEKQRGNEAFGRKEWIQAIGHYSAAHVADPTEPTIPLNRAMAYIKIAKFLDAERDCTKALQLSPNNVKALYRRATARIGAEKLEEAKTDFQQVLRLDPSNKEAKAELVKVETAIRATNEVKKEPIDLTKLRPLERQDADLDSSISSNTVEAARKFLQEVGMSDPSEADTKPATSSKSLRSVPAKLPGEAGGLLREVSTRTMDKRSGTGQTFQSLSSPDPLAVTTRKEKATAGDIGSSTATARKTASALSFGSGPSASKPVSSMTLPAPTSRTRSQMTAIEFQRRWKDKGNRIELLRSIDASTIPDMIDSLLEPDLVAEILQTLADRQKAASGTEKSELTRLAEQLLQELPKCKRFGMTIAMLDSSEKRSAGYLIEAVNRPELKTPWEIS